jgi:ABC-type glucose/galactose transport system permease subunit
MSNILGSASKLVLLMIVIVLCLIAMFASVWGIIHATLEPKEIVALFGTALTFVLGFYFGSKGDPAQPMAGK